MSLLLNSSGRKMYIPLVPLAFFVYDPDDESSMFNKEGAGLKTICLNGRNDNRKTNNLISKSEKINFHVYNRSFDCESRSLDCESRSLDFESLSFNSENLSFNCESLSFDCESPSLNCESLSFNCDNPSFDFETSSLNIDNPSFDCENPSLNCESSSYDCESSSYDCECLSFNCESRSLKTGNCKITGVIPFSKKTHHIMQNIQAWNLSGPDVSNINREVEDPESFRMPTGGQHAGLRESIQHWKR